jgi:two-component system, NarL family, invasion response regulator UvrY
MTRILVVDDSDEFRRSLRAVLADAVAGLAVAEARGSAEALELLAREPWDMVLLDLSLPDRSGIETLRDIRRLRPALPVLVMSFHSEAEYAAAARAAGAAAYLTKGSTSGVIAAAVRSALATETRPSPDGVHR